METHDLTNTETTVNDHSDSYSSSSTATAVSIEEKNIVSTLRKEISLMRADHEKIKQSRVSDQKRMAQLEIDMSVMSSVFNDLKKIEKEHDQNYVLYKAQHPTTTVTDRLRETDGDDDDDDDDRYPRTRTTGGGGLKYLCCYMCV